MYLMIFGFAFHSMLSQNFVIPFLRAIYRTIGASSAITGSVDVKVRKSKCAYSSPAKR